MEHALFQEDNEKSLNQIELQAVCNMISYVAYYQKVEAKTVDEITAAHFGANAVAGLPSRLYQNIIEYLIDLNVKNILN